MRCLWQIQWYSSLILLAELSVSWHWLTWNSRLISFRRISPRVCQTLLEEGPVGRFWSHLEGIAEALFPFWVQLPINRNSAGWNRFSGTGWHWKSGTCDFPLVLGASVPLRLKSLRYPARRVIAMANRLNKHSAAFRDRNSSLWPSWTCIAP